MTAPCALRGVRELVRRHVGVRADGIDLELRPAADGVHRHSYEVRAGRLRVTGTDPVAIAAGLARFAKQQCGVSASWDDERWLDLPAHLDDVAEVEHSTELEHRYYLNFVTYGYTAAFWDWNRWERELDWMALHGINRPLMAIGHEAVLLATYRELGLDDAQILDWIGSPAHFPWTWMGNTNRWGGPVPADWIDRHLALARRVLARQRELGMSPVLPGFAGHIPAALATATAREVEWQGWLTPVLEPGDEAFARAADVFYAQQARLLGDADYVAIDPFIESVPPSGDPADLAELARGLYAAMSAAKPHATLVLQGWPFHYRKGFWSPARIDAFLGGVPTDRVLLLDLWAEHAPMWRSSNGAWGRPWLWCAGHNFGGRPALFGDLAGLHRDLGEARSAADRGRLVGFGLAMEAIENNAVFYELATDLVWSPVDALEDWLLAFAGQRYRTDAPEAAQAWTLLAATLYAPGRTRSIPSPVIARPWSASAPFAAQRLAGEFLDTTAVDRPSANIDAENDPAVLGDLGAVADAAELLARLADGAAGDVPDALRRDVAELTGHVVAQHARLAIREILDAHAAENAAGVRAAGDRLSRSILDLDELAATRPESLVGGWIGAARAWGGTPEEQAVLERDARSLVSVWGLQTSGLHDYSGRHWSGLLRDYYLPRWRAWTRWLAESLETGAASDDTVLRERITAIEEDWRNATDPVACRYSRVPVGDTLILARRLLADRRPDLERLRRKSPTQHPNATPTLQPQ